MGLYIYYMCIDLFNFIYRYVSSTVLAAEVHCVHSLRHLPASLLNWFSKISIYTEVLNMNLKEYLNLLQNHNH